MRHQAECYESNWVGMINYGGYNYCAAGPYKITSPGIVYSFGWA